MDYPKPHKTFKEHGLTYVDQMVSPAVRQVLELMEKNPGSFILARGFSSAKMVMPGQPRITVKNENVSAICEWLKVDELEVNGHRKFILMPETMEYIRGMERRMF